MLDDQTDSSGPRLERIRRWADGSLVYLATAYWKEKQLSRDQSESVVQSMTKYAHVLALIEAPLEEADQSIMLRRAMIVERYLEDAKEGRTGWSPEGGIIDRR